VVNGGGEIEACLDLLRSCGSQTGRNPNGLHHGRARHWPTARRRIWVAARLGELYSYKLYKILLLFLREVRNIYVCCICTVVTPP
jgi:hypothetical protein